MRREGLVSIDSMRMREHSAKSAESEYVRISWAYTFTDNLTAKYTENLAHAHAVDTRPSLRIIEGLGTRLDSPRLASNSFRCGVRYLETRKSNFLSLIGGSSILLA